MHQDREYSLRKDKTRQKGILHKPEGNTGTSTVRRPGEDKEPQRDRLWQDNGSHQDLFPGGALTSVIQENCKKKKAQERDQTEAQDKSRLSSWYQNWIILSIK